MAVKRYSKQREYILNYLNSVTSHPTVETIFFEVRKKIPNISLGTVYRNLNQLAEEKTVLRLITDSGAEHYDGTAELHYHIVCSICGRIDDIDEMPIEGLDQKISNITGYKELSHTLHFYGICPACGKKQCFI